MPEATWQDLRAPQHNIARSFLVCRAGLLSDHAIHLFHLLGMAKNLVKGVLVLRKEPPYAQLVPYAIDVVNHSPLGRHPIFFIGRYFLHRLRPLSHVVHYKVALSIPDSIEDPLLQYSRFFVRLVIFQSGFQSYYPILSKTHHSSLPADTQAGTLGRTSYAMTSLLSYSSISHPCPA